MKKTLELTADQAKGMLGKDDLMDALIKANFSGKELGLNIMDRIKSHQDALDWKGETIEDFNWRTERDTDQQKATKELEDIADALRDGNELGSYWYYPYFKKVAKPGSGVGFAYHGYYYDDDRSYVCARLCVDTADKAIYMGKQFESIYNRHLAPLKK